LHQSFLSNTKVINAKTSPAYAILMGNRWRSIDQTKVTSKGKV
jgi:hypothetical protein